MHKATLFTTLSNYLISNEYIHCTFIIIEYLFFIFPSCLYSTIKLRHYSSTKEQISKSNPYINYISVYYYIFTYIPQPVFFVIITLILIGFLSLAIIALTGLSKNKKAYIPQKALVTFIDFVLFRYFASISIGYFAKFVIDLVFANTLIKSITAVIVMIAYAIYIIIGLYYINTQIVLLNITNPLLVQNPQDKQYPYDTISVYYDMNLFCLKIMICLEYHYFSLASNVNLIALTLNISIVLLSFILVAQFSFLHFCIQFKVSSLYANIKQNFLRNTISIFNSVLCLASICLFTNYDSVLDIFLLLFIAINFTIIITYTKHRDLIQGTLRVQSLSYDTLLLIMINDSKVSSLMYNSKLFINTVYSNHRKKCKESQCALQEVKTAMDYDTQAKALYKYLSKSKDKSEQSPAQSQSTQPIIKEIVKLLYYKLSNKSFKLFRWHYTLQLKYNSTHPSLTQQLNHIIDLLIFKDNAHQHQFEFFDNLVENSQLENQIVFLLDDMNTFFNANIQIKKPQTVINLSIKLKDVIDKFLELYKKNTQMTNAIALLNENDTKAISTVLGYNMMIIQCIIEKLINQSFSELPPFSLDQNEDYLNVHYNYDNVLVCSIDLLGSGLLDIQILKLTGELARMNGKQYHYFSELLPKCIKDIGIELMAKQLKSTNCQLKSITFPITSKGISFNVKYTFSVIERLERNMFLVYGQYIKDKKSCVLIDFSNENGKGMELLSFSNELLELFKLRRKWVSVLYNNHIRFYFNLLFSKVAIRDKDGDGDGEGDNNGKAIECEFDAKFFLSNSTKVIKYIKKYIDFKSNSLKKEKFKQIIENSSSKVHLVFEKVTQYSDTISLYNVYSQTKKQNIINYFANSLNNNSTNIEYHYDDSKMFLNFQSTISISQAGSGSSLSYTKSSFSSKGGSLETLINQKIKTEAKHLLYYSIIMNGLNILLIVISVIFLIIQVLQSKELLTLNDINLKFKNIRICMVGDFISLVSSVCFAETENQTDNCINGNTKYEKYFKEANGITDDIDIVSYLKAEIGLKAGKCLGTFSQFKTFVFSAGNSEFNTLLSKDLQYYLFQDADNDKEIKFINKTITLEEGIKEFFNTMFYLSNNIESYTEIPIYFVTYNKGNYSFESIPKNRLSMIQMEIYKGLFNFINFYVACNEIENDIENKINDLSKVYVFITIFIMIVIIFLNLILCFLSRQLLSKAYYLFKVVIHNIMNQFEDKNYTQHMNSKMSIFRILIRFYYKNPYDLIEKLEKSHLTFIKQQKALKGHSPNTNANSRVNYDQLTITPDITYPIKNSNKKKKKSDISFGHEFYIFLFKKLIYTLLSIFILFFIILITLDIVLYIIFQRTINICLYSSLQYKYETQMYNIFSLSTLARIGNFTNDNVAFILQAENTPDGVLNDILIRSSSLIRQISKYKAKDPNIYPSLATKTTYDCDHIFISVNDSYIHTISINLNYDYNKLASIVCNSFNLFSLPNFNFLFNDLQLRNNMIINRNVGNDYQSLYNSLNDFTFRELAMITLFSFRPLFSYFRWSVLLPLVSFNFNTYITLVYIVLCVDIVLETLMFFIVKWLLIKKISDIQKNLYLFNSVIKEIGV